MLGGKIKHNKEKNKFHTLRVGGEKGVFLSAAEVAVVVGTNKKRMFV